MILKCTGFSNFAIRLQARFKSFAWYLPIFRPSTSLTTYTLVPTTSVMTPRIYLGPNLLDNRLLCSTIGNFVGRQSRLFGNSLVALANRIFSSPFRRLLPTIGPPFLEFSQSAWKRLARLTHDRSLSSIFLSYSVFVRTGLRMGSFE